MSASVPSERPRIVAALGGNALLRRGEPPDALLQKERVEMAAAALAPLAERKGELVITHGNGPQVGLLALQQAAYAQVAPYPLDLLDAETEGMIGYLLELAVRSAVPHRPVVSLLTQVLVDRHDPAFDHPSKPIGPTYDRDEAARLAAERGWTVGRDGDAFRRLVPSPEPQAILELETLELLVESGLTVICGGGGGIPVALDAHGVLRGVEAVVDKDLTTALLGETLRADVLLLLTDVAAVERDWGTPKAEPIREATASELRELQFAAGSMGPKVEAAIRFVDRTGGIAVIGSLEEAERLVAGEAGTRVVPERALGDSDKRQFDRERCASARLAVEPESTAKRLDTITQTQEP